MTLGEIINAYRKEHGISMDEFAKKSGISKAYISILERNVNPISKKPAVPSLEKIKSVGDAIGRSLDEMLAIMGGDESISVISEKDNLPPPVITEDVVTFPIITSVAAHYGACSYGDIEGDTVDIPVHYLRGRPREDYCVMRVNGDSMYPDFRNNDLVLVLKQSTLDRPRNIGVIVYGEEEMTIKRIDYEPGEDWIELIPINPNFPPKRIEGAELERCRVIGVPRLLLREL